MHEAPNDGSNDPVIDVELQMQTASAAVKRNKQALDMYHPDGLEEMIRSPRD